MVSSHNPASEARNPPLVCWLAAAGWGRRGVGWGCRKAGCRVGVSEGGVWGGGVGRRGVGCRKAGCGVGVSEGGVGVSEGGVWGVGRRGVGWGVFPWARECPCEVSVMASPGMRPCFTRME